MDTSVLPVRGALRIVEQALLDTIRLALGVRAVVADATALAAVQTLGASPTNVLRDGEVFYVTDEEQCYFFRAASTAPAGAGIVVPSDRGGRAGRFIAAAEATSDEGTSLLLAVDGTPCAKLQSGYVRAVTLFQGERSKAEWESRILGRRPAVVIQFAGESVEQKSNLRGATKIKFFHFSIWGVSFNGRPGLEAALGSPVSAEAASDPGIVALMYDLEDLLDGLRGAQMGVAGIDHCRFGDVSPVEEDLTQRLFWWSAPLDVRCTVGKEDRPVRRQLEIATTTPIVPGSDPVEPAGPTDEVDLT